MHPTAQQLGLHLAWRFTEVLPGTFERDRKEVAGIKFPIVGPLPPYGKATPPLEGKGLTGPYLYVLFDQLGLIKYVGEATEERLTSPLERWIRPNKEKSKEYWAHGTNKKKQTATITHIAEGLNAGKGPYSLYFSNYRYFTDRMRVRSRSLGQPFTSTEALPPAAFIHAVEHALIYRLQPEWNDKKKKSPALKAVADCIDYWEASDET